MDNITFVTAYYKIYEKQNESYVEQFLKFADRGYKIVLFVDSHCLPSITPILAKENVKVVTDLNFEDLPLVTQFPRETTQLPASRNKEKDTYEYMILMNSKLEFIKLANVTTEVVAWIDFGITKIIKDLPLAFKKLDHIQVPEKKVLIPGCHGPIGSIIDRVNWRFCGGLLFATKPSLEDMYTLTNQVLTKLASQNKLTWEVNVWAESELINPSLFSWYQADHNDTIFNFPISKRVMVILMIKNESRIIKRCIEKALAIADAICISDTGSTDNTIDLLKEYLPTVEVPTKLVGHEWNNFGHNRTLSFNAAVNFCKELNWDLDMTYGLVLDADMNFVMTPAFSKTQLTSNGYRVLQKNGSSEYYNTRFMRLGHHWKCSGVTHEYWDGGDTDSLDTVYINDIGDGGCKDDKFIRDERLLRAGLEEDPKNARYMFYLANTLKDLKKLTEAIEWYKKRIDAGGWYEEIWYSMYMISRLYYELNKLSEMEYWGLKAYEFNSKRSENLYFLTRIFREKSEHYKAWYYMQKGLAINKPGELLFLETAVYENLFKYEKTILNYYIQPHKEEECIGDLLNYYNRYNGAGVYENLQHYVKPIKCEVRRLPFKDVGDYKATSTSILKNPDNTYLLNIRYVNYRIQPDGSYMMYQNGNLSRDHPVQTRNFSLLVDSNFNALSPLEEMIPAFPSTHTVHIRGLEDLRLYRDSDQTLRWIGTSMEYSYDGTIKQVTGRYNTTNNTLTDRLSIKPPHESSCEKNWIPLGNNKFIYGWHPFSIGEVDPQTEILKIIKTQQTPRFFQHMRGSSNIIKHDDGSLYAITHVVMYMQPRKYYHQVVRINPDRWEVTATTQPFYFVNNHIEYCLGIEIRDNKLFAIVSQNDADPILVTIDWSNLKFRPIQ
jgi:hypothetical protein